MQIVNDPPLEDIEKPENSRFAVFPLQHQAMFDHYKKQEDNFWTDSEISRDLMQDPKDRARVTPGERRLFDRRQTFFAIGDGVVVEILVRKLLKRIQILEVRMVLIYQTMMEQIHGITYSKIIDTAVTDAKEKNKLFNAATEDPITMKRVAWIQSVIHADNDLHELDEKDIKIIRNLIISKNGVLKALHPNEDIDKYKTKDELEFEKKAFTPKPPLAKLIALNAIIEGVFFSGSFLAVEWFGQKGLFPGAHKANKKIREDEGMHVNTSSLITKHFIKHKLPIEEIYEMMDVAVDIEIDSIAEDLPEGLTGMQPGHFEQYVKFQEDYVLKKLGYKPK